MRILLLSDDCNPDWPSLPVVSYKFARAIADRAEVVVATQVRNRPNLERVGLGSAEIVYLDTEYIAAPLYRFAQILRGGSDLGWTLQMAMNYPSYLAFEWEVWRHFRTALVSGQFDLVHRISPMTPTLPSLIAKRSPVPFILGPLNGNLPWPSAFQSEQKREREWLSRFRQAYKWLPFYRSTYHHAQAILAAFDHTFNDLPHSAQAKAINFPEVGIDPELFSFPVRPVPQQLTFLYVGRLVPYKMPEVVVQAFAHSPVLQQHRLIIVGEGPERSRLETLITAAQLEHCVTLTGQVPQAEVGNLMRQADVFAFPSIRELGAGVVIEAMASGLACVVVDYGGPATLIQPDRGITIPLSHPAQLTDHFRQTLEDLAQQPDRVRQLGLAAYQHAIQYYTWQVKAEKMMQIYEWVLHRRPAKPNFWQANPILPTPSPWVNS